MENSLIKIRWWESMGAMYYDDGTFQGYEVEAILAEHTRRIVEELKGIKQEPSKIYESHYEDGKWKMNTLDNPLAYNWNAAIDEAIKRIKRP